MLSTKTVRFSSIFDQNLSQSAWKLKTVKMWPLKLHELVLIWFRVLPPDSTTSRFKILVYILVAVVNVLVRHHILHNPIYINRFTKPYARTIPTVWYCYVSKYVSIFMLCYIRSANWHWNPSFGINIFSQYWSQKLDSDVWQVFESHF